MTHNLLGVGDDRWLRESLRRDPLQELRECKEELARKVIFVIFVTFQHFSRKLSFNLSFMQ